MNISRCADLYNGRHFGMFLVWSTMPRGKYMSNGLREATVAAQVEVENI